MFKNNFQRIINLKMRTIIINQFIQKMIFWYLFFLQLFKLIFEIQRFIKK